MLTEIYRFVKSNSPGYWADRLAGGGRPTRDRRNTNILILGVSLLLDGQVWWVDSSRTISLGINIWGSHLRESRSYIHTEINHQKELSF